MIFFSVCVWGGGGGGGEACPYCQKFCEQKVERNKNKKKRSAPFPTVVINSFKPGVPFMGHRQTE